jgi:hypothetical protein
MGYETMRIQHSNLTARAAAGAMHKTFAQVAVPGLLLLLTACGGNMEDPNIQLNPNASMRYEILIRIEGAPDTFDSIKAATDYQVTNESCVPMKPVSGVKVAPTKRIDLDLISIGHGEYRTVVFADRLLDDDYFGKGTCHWSLVASGIIAKKGGTAFSASISHENIVSQASEVTFYATNALRGTANILDTGSTDKHTYAEAKGTFSITLSAKESMK